MSYHFRLSVEKLYEKDETPAGILSTSQKKQHSQMLIEASAERDTFGQVFDQMIMLLENLLEAEDPTHGGGPEAYREYLKTLAEKDEPPF